MKTLFVIPLHSAVSLITNSSSELFVCNTDKTLETIKEIVKKFLDSHNKLSGSNYTFEGCFGDISIANYSFDYDKFPENLKREYEKYHSRPGDWSGNYWGNNSERPILEAKSQELVKKYNTNEKDLYTKNEKEYNRRMRLYEEENDKLWFEYRKADFLSEYNLFLYLIKNGDFQDSQIAKVKRIMKKAINEKTFKVELWRMRDLKDQQLVETERSFGMCMSYGIKIEKGNILIWSKGDNSIPWEIQTQIESYLGTRYHLG